MSSPALSVVRFVWGRGGGVVRVLKAGRKRPRHYPARFVHIKICLFVYVCLSNKLNFACCSFKASSLDLRAPGYKHNHEPDFHRKVWLWLTMASVGVAIEVNWLIFSTSIVTRLEFHRKRRKHNLVTQQH